MFLANEAFSPIEVGAAEGSLQLAEVVLSKLPPLHELLACAYPKGPTEGYPPSVPHAGPFHCFLSHNWEQ